MKNWLICLFGAANGVAFVAAARLIALYFEYLQRKTIDQDAESAGSHYVQLAGLQEKWLGATVLIVLVFILASYAVNHFWRTKRRDQISAWVLIGLSAITIWNLFILGLGLWDRLSLGQTLIIESISSPTNPLHGPLSLGIVLIVNLIYGSILQLTWRDQFKRPTERLH